MSVDCADLQPGAIAYGRSGVPLQVIKCNSKFITVQRPDGQTIDVKPSAILRWEKFSEFASPESEVKISSEPSESTIEALESLSDKGFASDDTSKSIVRISSELSESIVRKQEYRPNIVRQESLPVQGIQPFSDGSDGSDDIFEPLSAQRNFEDLVVLNK